MKTELITKLEALLEKDPNEVSLEVRALQKEYQRVWAAEFESAKQAYVDEGGRAKEFEYHKQPDDLKFEALVDKFAKLKKQAEQALAAEQARNLTIRMEII